MNFEFVQKSMSAYDAYALLMDDPETAYQFAVAASESPQHELQVHLDNAEPGDPTSPVIREVSLSPSGLYIDFRFADTPVYVTIPAMSTVTLGWLRPRDDESVEAIRNLLQGDPWHAHHRHNAPPNS